MVAIRKSSWLKAYHNAWRTFGLSNGLCRCSAGRRIATSPAATSTICDVRILLQGAEADRGWAASMKSISPFGKRVDRLLRVGNGAPLDAIHLGDLAARETRGRLGARLVLVELDVNGLVAGLPFILDEDEGAGSREILDLLVGVGVGDALGHHERHVGRRLRQAEQHEAGRFLELDGESLGIDRIDRSRRRSSSSGRASP